MTALVAPLVPLAERFTEGTCRLAMITKQESANRMKKERTQENSDDSTEYY